MTVKRFFTILIIAALMTSLSGCAGKNNKEDQLPGEESILDAYGCVVDEIIKLDIKSTFISRNFLFPDAASKISALYDENGFKQVINSQTVNSDGTSVSGDIECENLIMAGFNASKDSIVLVTENYDKERKAIVETRTLSGDLINKVELDTDYVISSLNSEVYTDKDGYIYISNMEKEDAGGTIKCSCIFDSTGKVFAEITAGESDDTSGEKASFGLGILPDDRIYIDCISAKGDGVEQHRLSVYDTKEDGCEAILEYDGKIGNDEDAILALSVFEGNQLVYMTKQGVFLSDYSFNNNKCIFNWKKNGVELIPGYREVNSYRICANQDKRVCILLDKGDCVEYLELAEIPEDIFTVEIAGNSGINQYGRAVVEYNKSHLDSHIVIKNDYEKTALLTRIIAGDGPVIIEDGVINVRDNESIWEPLENLVKEETIGKLNKGAIICGRINDKLYGAPTGFSIDTLVTGETVSEWNYDEFLGCIDGNGRLKTITDNSLLSGKQQVLESVFCNGISDTFFVDASDKNRYVDDVKLETVIKLIDKYQTAYTSDRNSFEMVADGTMLCARFAIHSPLDYYRILYAFGDKGNVVGYPGKNGSKHYIAGAGTLFARNNMTAKEKEVVSDFFELLLSYEGQMQIYENNHETGLSAREDVLNTQIGSLKEYEGERGAIGGVWFTYENIDLEKVKEKLNELLEKGVPFPSRNDVFYGIMSEELDDYYNGKIDLVTLTDHLGKRIGLYIKEQE